MDFVFILFFILSFFIVTFALLHLLAAGAALLKGDKTTGNILIFVGGLIALPAIPLLAYMNGKEKGNNNTMHHVIRITIAILLTIGLALV